MIINVDSNRWHAKMSLHFRYQKENVRFGSSQITQPNGKQNLLNF